MTAASGITFFLTRDPIGYADGPNVYCYVHCNPITRFDAWGLNQEEVDEAYEEMDKAAENAQQTWDKYTEAQQNEEDAYKEYQKAREAYEADNNGDTKKARDRAKAAWNKSMRGTDSAAERHQVALEELEKACGDFRTALADHRADLEGSPQKESLWRRYRMFPFSDIGTALTR
jgi:tetratricopeptide (TPR) repeat protein